MSLLQTLKSLLGLESSQREPRRNGDVGVTVERDPGEPDPPSSPTGTGAAEPEAQSEHEVKGTDEATGADATADVDSSAEETDTDADTETVAVEDAEAPDSKDAETADSGAGGEALTEIKGIGAAYADRLEAAGIDDTAALADADREALAAETDLSEKRLGRWVERARNR